MPLIIKLMVVIIPLGMMSLIFLEILYYSNMYPEYNSWMDDNLVYVLGTTAFLLAIPIVLITAVPHKVIKKAMSDKNE